jgi:O-antigen ligase
MATLRQQAPKIGAQLMLVYALWFVFLFDPQWVLDGKWGIRIFLKLPTVLTIALTISMLMNPRKGDMLWGMLLWIATTAINLPGVQDFDRAMIPFRQMCFFYLLGMGVVRAVKTPYEARIILFMTCIGQYLWWAAWGIQYGRIPWHPYLANLDGYGPLMAVGVGPAYYYAMAADDKNQRRLGYVVAALCVVGVINSFARGAVVGLAATMGYIWLRSPRKGRTTGIMLAAAVVVGIAASQVNGLNRGVDTKGNFWDEMKTIFVKEEGKEDTGDDRKHLWTMAYRVFKQNPWLGAGPEHFGVAAAEYHRQGVEGFRVGEVKGRRYEEDPSRLYGRALHSNYFQLISEFGIIGTAIFGFILLDFYLKNRRLHRPEAIAAWRAGGGGADIRMIAIGLECGMVAYLVTGVFFNQLFASWFFTLMFANLVVYSIVKERLNPSPAAAVPTGRRGQQLRR